MAAIAFQSIEGGQSICHTTGQFNLRLTPDVLRGAHLDHKATLGHITPHRLQTLIMEGLGRSLCKLPNMCRIKAIKAHVLDSEKQAHGISQRRISALGPSLQWLE